MKKLLLLCLVLLGGVMQVSADTRIIYLKPQGTGDTSWTQGNERYALYAFNSTENGWIDFSAVSGYNGYYTATYDTKYTTIIICRMNGSTTENKWDNRWFQTRNITAPDKTTIYYTGTDRIDNNNHKFIEYPVAQDDNYYIYYSTNTNSLGGTRSLMEYDGSFTYSIVIDNQAANAKYYSMIVPESAETSAGNIGDWSKLIFANERTGTDDGGSNYYYDISWSNGQSGNAVIPGGYNRWRINQIAAKFKLSYDWLTSTWSMEPYFTRTLPAAAQGYATFSSTYDVIPDGNLTAVQYASAVNSSTGHITWESFPATGIKAGEGALLTGTAGNTYRFIPASSAVATGGNCLKPITSKAQLSQTSNGNTNFILTLVGTDVGFYKVNENKSWCNAGTAYLAVPGVSFARDFFALDGETTGIANVEINANDNFDANAPMYNLAGQRVNKSYKGVVIVNGKKMLNK